MSKKYAIRLKSNPNIFIGATYDFKHGHTYFTVDNTEKSCYSNELIHKDIELFEKDGYIEAIELSIEETAQYTQRPINKFNDGSGLNLDIFNPEDWEEVEVCISFKPIT